MIVNVLPQLAVQAVDGKDGKKIMMPIPPKITLANRGPIIIVEITHPMAVVAKMNAEKKVPPSVRVNALIDTGAGGCIISPKVAADLQLIRTGVANITSVQDEQQRPAYFAQIMFHWGKKIEVQVAECPIKGFDCIIGRNVLMHWHFTYNGSTGQITICD